MELYNKAQEFLDQHIRPLENPKVTVIFIETQDVWCTC